MFFLLPIGVQFHASPYPVVTFTLMGLNTLIFLLSFVLRWSNLDGRRIVFGAHVGGHGLRGGFGGRLEAVAMILRRLGRDRNPQNPYISFRG